MKVAIIGAGNMGGAIARGLAQGHYVRVQDITVTNPSSNTGQYRQSRSGRCRCGDCSGQALEGRRSIEAFAFAPASGIGIGSGRDDFRRPCPLCRPRNANVSYYSEHCYLFAGKYDTDSLPECIRTTDTDNVGLVQ